MEDYDCPTTSIESICKNAAEKVDCWTLTDAREFSHKGTDALKRQEVAVQTDRNEIHADIASAVTVSNEVLNILLSAVKNNNERPNILARLNALHRTDSVTLSMIRQFQLPEKQELPLHSVIPGPNGRAAFVFADRYHDSWCSHNGVIILWQRRTVTETLMFSSCPTVLRYGPQGIIAVGLFTGHISLIFDGKIISTKEAHSLSVTAIEWLSSSKQLISVSLDGRIIVHTLKSNSLEEKHSKLVTVNNLPHNLRKANTAYRYTGLTSLCVAKDRLFVGGETGAVWTVTLPDLTLSLFHYEIDCIERLAHISNHTVIITSSGRGVVVSKGSASVQLLETNTYNVCVTNANIAIFGNYEQISAIHLDDFKELLKQNLEHQAFALVPDDDALIVVDRQLLVTLYRINFNQ